MSMVNHWPKVSKTDFVTRKAPPLSNDKTIVASDPYKPPLHFIIRKEEKDKHVAEHMFRLTLNNNSPAVPYSTSKIKN